jgi:hypothetical protein
MIVFFSIAAFFLVFFFILPIAFHVGVPMFFALRQK